MNRCSFTGRITKDLAIKETTSGTKLLGFDIAVQRDFKNSDGEYDTDFIRCLAFKGAAEFLTNYAKKGYLVTVSGRLQNNNFEREDGTTNYGMQLLVNEIDASTLFLNKGKNDDQQDSYQQQATESRGQSTQTSSKSNGDNPFANANGPIDITDDDLPF